MTLRIMTSYQINEARQHPTASAAYETSVQSRETIDRRQNKNSIRSAPKPNKLGLKAPSSSPGTNGDQRSITDIYTLALQPLKSLANRSHQALLSYIYCPLTLELHQREGRTPADSHDSSDSIALLELGPDLVFFDIAHKLRWFPDPSSNSAAEADRWTRS